MGTPDFAVPTLKALIENYEVVGVFTQPDKFVGRHRVLTPPPVKVCALENGITVYQPAILRDGEAMSIIEKLAPDAIVVVAYGKILPTEILEFPKLGCINIHGSLLPRLRGAAPIQWAIVEGDKKTGITTMYMNDGIDTGEVRFGKPFKRFIQYDKPEGKGKGCGGYIRYQSGTSERL